MSSDGLSRRRLLAGSAGLAAGPLVARAQDRPGAAGADPRLGGQASSDQNGSAAQTGPGSAAEVRTGPRILITTAAGEITAEVYPDRAPITAKNFLRYVSGRRFDGASFYRAVNTPGAPGTGFIQGGAQNDPKRLYPPIAHESTTQTGLKHGDGTLSMARGAPGTATGDFFITVGPASYFDANPAAPGDNLGYAAFGQVVLGMEVVRAILAMPTNGFARNPAMKGQILSLPVPIIRAQLIAP